MLHRFSLYGYPIELRGRFTARELPRLLGENALGPARGQPVLTVELVPDLKIFERNARRARTPEILLGEDFALNYSERRAYFPRSAGTELKVKHLGPQKFLPRTIMFCLGLLAEYHGLPSVLRPPAARQVPLYLHASAVATPKGALVFCGQSTFGKSTISSKLLADYPLLEDDQVNILISPLGSARPVRPRVVSFTVKGRGNAWTLPLAGIVWLKKGRAASSNKCRRPKRRRNCYRRR
jgi:hypothetical protein